MAVNANTILYTSANLFAMSSILVGILGFLLAKQGWDNNNFYLKSSFLILSFASTYFGLVPVVFNNKEIGKFNTAKYLECDKLQIHIYGLLNDASILAQDNNNQYTNLDSIVSEMNLKIENINNVSFDIYTEKVPADYKIISNK
ncbi:hypothetical protein ACVWYF_000662 [Hymenobacter sp. UYAg731]